MTDQRIIQYLESNANDDFLDGIRIEMMLAEICEDVSDMVEASGLTRREIAARMGSQSPATVQRIAGPGGAYNARLETLVRLASACGYRMAVGFVERDAVAASAKLCSGWQDATDTDEDSSDTEASDELDLEKYANVTKLSDYRDGQSAGTWIVFDDDGQAGCLEATGG